MSSVIVVSGPPGAGKTTLAKELSQRLRLPIIAKDMIKESLADDLGYGERARSVELGFAAFQLHLKIAKELSSNGVDFIYETAFYSQSTQDITTALEDASIIQAWVHADLSTMLDRANNRERHPGHADWYDGYEKEYREKYSSGIYDALAIGGTLIDVDSNDFQASAYLDAVEEIVQHYRASTDID